MYSVLLIDAKHALWRSAEAYRELWITVDGERQATGAVYGLLNIITRVRTQFLKRDGNLIVCWEGGNLKRRKLFPKYKRKEDVLPPERLQLIASVGKQQDIARKLLAGLGVAQAYAPGWEADDVMGTLAKRWSKTGLRVGIFTGDQDLWQCISERVHVLRPERTGDIEVVNLRALGEHTGLTPRDFLLAKALAGDRGDNIPGVRGIGEKNATKIVTGVGQKDVYWNGSIADLARCALEHLALTPRIKVNLQDSLETGELELWYKLARIRRKVEVKFQPPKKWRPERVARELMKLRFRSWLQEDRIDQLLALGGR